MLVRKLLQIRKADAELPKEIRAALIEFAFCTDRVADRGRRRLLHRRSGGRVARR